MQLLAKSGDFLRSLGWYSIIDLGDITQAQLQEWFMLIVRTIALELVDYDANFSLLRGAPALAPT